MAEVFVPQPHPLYPGMKPLPKPTKPKEKSGGMKGMLRVSTFNRQQFQGLFKSRTCAT